MAYSILNITRRNSKELNISIQDGVVIPNGTDIIFIDSSESSNWASINSPEGLPNAVKYFTKVNTTVSTNSNYVVRDIPYRVGSHTLFIKHQETWYKKLDVILTAESLPSPFPGTLNRATTKQKLPLINNNDLKGNKIFTDIYDLLMLGKEDMTLGMKCTIWLEKENQIKTYALNPNYSIDSIPYPLQDYPYDINEPRETDIVSFRKYWYLDSVAEPELQPVARVQYAPEFNGGIPPYFEGYISDSVKSDGYTFPTSSVWDEERAFTSTQWSDNLISLGENKSIWKRFKKTINGNWSRPIRIDQVTSGYLANRFARRFQFPQQTGNLGTLVDFKIQTFFKGEVNLLAEYSIDEIDYTFEDTPPAKKTWEELTTEEKTKYVTYYNSTYSSTTGYQALTISSTINSLPNLTIDGLVITARQLIEKDNNRLWVVYAQKDDFSNLESPWTDIQLFIEDNPALVRFNSKETNGLDAINEIRKQIAEKVNSQGGVESDYYQDYIDKGWVKDYNFNIHSYVATRESTTDAWIIQKIKGESGIYEDIVYKEYPINYYDRLNNSRTKFNYIPIGVGGTKNPQDDITGDPVDTAFQPRQGYELYFSTVRKNFQNTTLLTEWSTWIRASARPAVIDVIESSTDSFKSIEITTGSNTIIQRENTTLSLEAKLFLEQEEIIEGNIYQEENIAEGIVERREEIRYTWKRLFNNGNAENLVLLDQSPNRLYYGYKNQTDFDNYFEVGDEEAEITPLNTNANFKLDYRNDDEEGLRVIDKSDNSNTTLRRIALTSNSEGYKRDGILYDASDAVVTSNIWVTDDLSKLDDPTWVDFIAYEFDYSYDYSTRLLSLISSQRATFLRQVTYTENEVESTVAPFSFSSDGKTITVHHAGVDGKTVFEVTQWRKIVENEDFAGVDEDYISYKSEKVIIDLIDRVKRAVSILPDLGALIAKPNFTNYTESEFIGKKSITISAFLENVPVGSWYVFKHDTYNFLDAEKGINAFSGITFKEVLEDATYWTDLEISTQSYNVTFAQFIAGDNSLIPYKTYKYESVESSIKYLDFVTLNVNFAGQSPRDIRIAPDNFIIALNEAGDDFDGSTSVTFTAFSENVDSPYYEWKLLDKAGATVKTLVGNSTSYPANIANQFTIDFATDALFGANEAERIDYIQANAPFRVTCKDLVVNLNSFVEQAIITFIQGGIAGLKGEDGVGGINVIYNNTDLVPSQNDGTVTNVNEETNILVYRGIEAQVIGTDSGEFNVDLVDARDASGTAIAVIVGGVANVLNTGGVNITVPTPGTILVTALPNDKDLVVVRFKIKEGATPIKDDADQDVVFEYKLKKAKAGKPAWNFYLSNQFQSLNLNLSSLPITTTQAIAGNSYYVIGSTSFDIIEGASNRNSNLRASIRPSFNLVAVPVVITYQGNLYNYFGVDANHGIAVGQTVNNILGLSRIGQPIIRVFSITLPANPTFGNPKIDTNLTTVLIPAGKKANQYFLSATSNYFETGSSDILVSFNVIQNDPTEVVQQVTGWKINNRDASLFGTTISSTEINATLLVRNNNFIVNEPILSIEVSIIVISSGQTYVYKEYFEIINKTNQRLIVPLYGGTISTAGNVLDYTKQNSYSFNNGTLYVDFNNTIKNNFRNLFAQIPVRRVSNDSTLEVGGVIAFSNGVFYNDRTFTPNANLAIKAYWTYWFSFTANNDLIGDSPKVQAWVVEQPDGTMRVGDFFPILGEAGERGRTYVYKEVYLEVAEGAAIPTKPSNKTLFSSASLTGNEESWTTVIPTTQGTILYTSKILLEKDAPDSQFDYRYAETSFSNPLRLTGVGGVNVVRAYGIATVSDTQRASANLPTNYNTNPATFDSNSTVYVIEKYVDASDVGIKRFDLVGNYSNLGTHFWSKRTIFRKDGTSGSAGSPGRGIVDARINGGNLEFLYSQAPNNSVYQNLGQVVGTGSRHLVANGTYFPVRQADNSYRFKTYTNQFLIDATLNTGDLIYGEWPPIFLGLSNRVIKGTYKVISRNSSQHIVAQRLYEEIDSNQGFIEETLARTSINQGELTLSTAISEGRLVSNRNLNLVLNGNTKQIPEPQRINIILYGTASIRRDSGGDDIVRLSILREYLDTNGGVVGSRVTISTIPYRMRGGDQHQVNLMAFDALDAGAEARYFYQITSAQGTAFLLDEDYDINLLKIIV